MGMNTGMIDMGTAVEHGLCALVVVVIIIIIIIAMTMFMVLSS